MDKLGIASIAILSWMDNAVDNIAKQLNASIPESPLYRNKYKSYIAELNGQKISIINVPIGSSATILVMEEMIACGTKTFIGFGLAGSLNRKANVGSILIPNDCIIEEGTSKHYITANGKPTSSNRLSEILANACKEEGINPFVGKQWTTDAPYKETIDKIEEYSNQGVNGVDMETSAMYTIGRYRSVDVCNLLVVSDELWQEWKPMFGTPILKNAIRKAEQIVLKSLEIITKQV
jgi:uridine phosphorylase